MHMSRKLRTILEAMDDEVSRDLLTSERTENGDYLGTRSGWLTYLPAGKDVEKPYASKNRVRGKPARVARKFTREEHTDAAYEAFHNLFEAKAFSVKNIAMLRGEDIVSAYNDLYDKRRQSRTMQSCMVGADLDQFDLYVRNPHVVRLLVLWDRFKGQDVLVARALVWKTPDGIYVDRIYGSDTAVTFLKRYVDKKGWMRYTHYGEARRHPKKRIRIDLEIQKGAYTAYPYLDTFILRSDNYHDNAVPYYLEGDIPAP